MTAIVLSEGVCDFCQSDTAILTCDLLYRLEDITAHYFCLLFSSGLGQRGEDCDGIRGFLASDIRRELRRGARLKCVFCKKKGATVGCAEAACKKSYHLNCGARHDCLMQFFGQFKSLCSRHRGRPRARRSAATPTTCTICQQELGGARGKRDHSILTSGCCDTATFHRDCVQQLSVSAGRAHFRCPNCNDTASWVAAMLEAGVYVPEQDASWEQEPGPDTAPPRLCHAKLCFCPHEAGRAHHSEHGLWEILTCDACGHKGIHAKCGGLENVSEAAWRCYTCRTALGEEGQEDAILSAARRLVAGDQQMAATLQLVPGLADKLECQGLQLKPVTVARPRERERVVASTKYNYSTSFTDLLGSLLDRDDSPGDSDYESGDKNTANCTKVDV